MLPDLEKYNSIAQVSQGLSAKFPRKQKDQCRPSVLGFPIAKYGQEQRVT